MKPGAGARLAGRLLALGLLAGAAAAAVVAVRRPAWSLPVRDAVRPSSGPGGRPAVTDGDEASAAAAEPAPGG